MRHFNLLIQKAFINTVLMFSLKERLNLCRILKINARNFEACIPFPPPNRLPVIYRIQRLNKKVQFARINCILFFVARYSLILFRGNHFIFNWQFYLLILEITLAVVIKVLNSPTE